MAEAVIGGFVKIHGKLVMSSVWNLDGDTCKVWITLLCLADPDGIVQGSVGGLAAQCRLSVEKTQEALKIFLGPDPFSSDGTSGERSEEVPGGWMILNHGDYRDRTTRRQVLAAERSKRWREKQKKKKKTVTRDARHASSRQEEEEEVPRPVRKRKTETYSEDFENFWSIYQKNRSKKLAYQRWRKINPDDELIATILTQAKAYRESAEKQFRKDPATWLNQECWNDEIIQEATVDLKKHISKAAGNTPPMDEWIDEL